MRYTACRDTPCHARDQGGVMDRNSDGNESPAICLMSKYTKASQSLTSGRGMEMQDDRAREYRASAAQCLGLAATASDPRTRSVLLLMAQRWMELANGIPKGLQG